MTVLTVRCRRDCCAREGPTRSAWGWVVAGRTEVMTTFGCCGCALLEDREGQQVCGR